MKISIHIMFFILPFLLMAFGISNKPLSIGNPITIEINVGKGANCYDRGRLCNASAIEMNSSQISPETDALGKAYFDSNGHFVMEINILFTDAITDELSDGVFNLEENFQLSSELMTELGRSSDTVILNSGNYMVEQMEDNIYRIVF